MMGNQWVHHWGMWLPCLVPIFWQWILWEGWVLLGPSATCGGMFGTTAAMGPWVHPLIFEYSICSFFLYEGLLLYCVDHGRYRIALVLVIDTFLSNAVLDGSCLLEFCPLLLLTPELYVFWWQVKLHLRCSFVECLLLREAITLLHSGWHLRGSYLNFSVSSTPSLCSDGIRPPIWL